MSACPRPPVLMAYGEGVLPEEQSGEVGRHLEHCRLCRGLLEDLRSSCAWEGDPAAVRRVRLRMGMEMAGARPRRLAAWWGMVPAACVVALALAVAVPPPPASLPAMPPQARIPAPDWDLPGLARVEPAPVNIDLSSLLVWRGSAGTDDLVQALALYRKGDYSRAVEALEAVKGKRPAAKPYLAVSLLMLGRNDEALAELAGESGDEARWYRAQAALRLGRFGMARQELEAACQARGSRGPAACDLLRELLLPGLR